jgi:hypothetical protein
MTWLEVLALATASLLFFWVTGVRVRLKQLQQDIHQSAQMLQQQIQHRHAMLEPFVRSPQQASSQDNHFRRAVACHAQVLAACTLMVEQPRDLPAWQSFGQAEQLFQEAMQIFLSHLPSKAQIRQRSNSANKSWQPFQAAWAQADGQVRFVKQTLNDKIERYNLAMPQNTAGFIGRRLGHAKIPTL